MNRKDLIDRLQELYKDEDSRVTINPHAEQKVAIVYPNTYCWHEQFGTSYYLRGN